MENIIGKKKAFEWESRNGLCDLPRHPGNLCPRSETVCLTRNRVRLAGLSENSSRIPYLQWSLALWFRTC